MWKQIFTDVRERAVRMVFEHQGEFDSQSAAIKSIAPKIGCGPDTLRAWVQRDGVTTAERDRIKALDRENRQLRQASEILKKASAYFAPTLIVCFPNDCRAAIPASHKNCSIHKTRGKEHRELCEVEPICRVLKIAPSTFYAPLAVERDPDKASDRAKRDAELRPERKRVWRSSMGRMPVSRRTVAPQIVFDSDIGGVSAASMMMKPM